MDESMKLAILKCYKEERNFVVPDTLDTACMRFGYYLEVSKQELKEAITCK